MSARPSAYHGFGIFELSSIYRTAINTKPEIEEVSNNSNVKGTEETKNSDDLDKRDNIGTLEEKVEWHISYDH